MDPNILDPTALAQDFGPAALTVGLVALIRANWTLTPRASLIAALLSALVATLCVHSAAGPVAWGLVPLDVLKAWLMSMGAWSGGKAGAGK